MVGVQAAVHTEEGKNQGRVGQTKVKRYRAGQAPDFAGSDSDDEEEVINQQAEAEEQTRTHVAAPVIVKKADDPRLRRLAAVRAPEIVKSGGRRHGSDVDDSEDEDEVAARRRRARQRARQEEDEEEQEQGEEDEEAVGTPSRPKSVSDDEGGDSDGDEDGEVEEDEEAIAMRRQMLRAKLQERQQQEATAAAAAEESEDSDEESEYETDSEDEDGGRQMLKPVFVSKSERETIKERERLEQQEQQAFEREKVRKEERKAETRDIVIENIKREEEAELAGPAKEENEVNTDDDDDEEVEFEAWKQRELQRIKVERDAKEAAEKEAAERERLKNMTEEERAAWELANPKVRPEKEKKKWGFMQKYWHKGAYFQETSDGKDQTGVDDIFKRDFSAPTGEDRMDKSTLPSVMQVKNFGRSGRSKYTHLLDQDTTDWEAPKFDRAPKDGRKTTHEDFSRPKKLKT